MLARMLALTSLVLLTAPVAARGATNLARDDATNTITLTAVDPRVSIFINHEVGEPALYLFSEQGLAELPDDTSCDPDPMDGPLLFRCPTVPVRAFATLTAGDDYLESEGALDAETCAPVPVTVDALGGFDHIIGKCGDDSINGGDDGDVIHAGDGDNNVTGGEGYDEIFTGDGDDTIDGGNGHATIDTGSGNDHATGGDGEDGIWTADGADTLIGLANDDTLSGGDDDDTIQGGDGDDALTGGNGKDGLDAGSGDDSLSGGAGDDSLTGGAGADGLLAGEGNDKLAGGDGPDRLAGGVGNDDLDGGEGVDALDGGDDDDALKGAGGRDLLEPGRGNDTVAGGGDLDTISYESRDAAVTITLGGGGGNGEQNENDTIANDVENATGGAAADRINGDGNINALDGLAGDDTIEPRGGTDSVDAGAGNDTVLARDGAPDRIECGDGGDKAVTDAFDTTSNCETVDASRELMSDVDNDGAPAGPADCDDRNPFRRAGFPDRPGNGIDEDCSGGDAPYPRVLTGITTKYKLTSTTTRFTSMLALDVPPEATIELRCTGRGCFRGVKRRTVRAGAAEVNLTSLVNKSRLRPKAVLEVRVLRTEAIGKVVRYTVQRATARVRKAPKTSQRCLRPGTATPGPC